MKRIQYAIVIPDDMEVDSVVINLERKKKEKEFCKRTQDTKRIKNNPNKPAESEEPDEGLLYDELY